MSQGFFSRLVIQSDRLYIDIFEEIIENISTFTQQSIDEINKELKEVLKHANEINETGILPVKGYYKTQYDSTFFTVTDGTQQGIYILRAAYNASCPGELFVKAFETRSEKKLSSKIITLLSTKQIGWSKKGNVFFPYECEVTLYENTTEKYFQARFELWYRNKDGEEIKIRSITKLVQGWRR